MSGSAGSYSPTGTYRGCDTQSARRVLTKAPGEEQVNKTEKLGEAEYFLQRMRDVIEDRDHFKYNLSAFLSAARSVIQYIFEDTAIDYLDQCNGKVKRKADVWYCRTMECKILKYLRDKRDLNIHEGPIRTSAVYNVCSGPQGVQSSTRWFFKDWPGSEDTLEVCETGLQRIHAFVAEGRKLGHLDPLPKQ